MCRFCPSVLLLLALSHCGGELIGLDSDAGRSPRDVATADASEYHEDLTNKEHWSAFQPAFLSPLTDLNRACFDGRYVYWGGGDSNTGPNFPIIFMRYDTHAAFDDPNSWLLWKNFPGVTTESLVFDGRYVYTGSFRGAQQMRFDTQGTFGDKKALAITSPIPGTDNLDYPASATFDGRYVYYSSCAPYRPDCAKPGLTARFDTQRDFFDLSAWSTFDVQVAGATGPAIVLGTSLLLTPAWSAGTQQSGQLAVYDTGLPFDSSGSWTARSLPTAVGTEAFMGAGTDGRYAYLVPRATSGHLGDPAGVVARVDKTTSEWSTFDTGSVNPLAKHYDHISWDGRYVYFTGGGSGTVLTRYDTHGAFSSSQSWQVFDVGVVLPTHLFSPMTGTGEVVFDGEYVYMSGASIAGGPPLIVRYDARTGHQMPKGFSGTFY